MKSKSNPKQSNEKLNYKTNKPTTTSLLVIAI